MAQHQRTETVAAFKAGSLPLLIATDVAARGLDIPGVECVINYRRAPAEDKQQRAGVCASLTGPDPAAAAAFL